jgi:tRNA (guanine26-N2/guanine27-N2)-dimethyltransferase
LHDICKTVHCTPPKAATFRSALINAGYRVSGSHANPLAVKTDAPPSVIWDILRCWIKDHPIKPVDPNSYAGKLLAKEPQLQANFAKAKGSVSAAQQQGVTRFAQNPAFWGPKARHGKLDKAEMLQHAAAQQGARQQRKRGKQQQQQQQQEGEEEAGPSTSGQAPAAAAAAAAAAAGGDGTAGNTAAAAAAAPTGAAAGDANGTHEGPPAGAKQAGSEAAGSPAAKKQKVGAAATT